MSLIPGNTMPMALYTSETNTGKGVPGSRARPVPFILAVTWILRHGINTLNTC
ncbi:hypothetical protein JG687_00006416 [Phytophthora cactorum]|uniref:Uncharacterized protein n=1 Tax=Phytophthora cactorum TaxID=29920 RepID=A0A8T1UJM8_9STRA|nr:hypothetical protein JG687_00006416 [Phytophthora cactorum]